MKNPFFRYTTGIILFIAISACAYAQNNKLNEKLKLNSSSSKEVDYSSDAKTALPAAPADPLTSINAKAVKSFSKSYKKQSNAAWFTIEDGFVAIFTEGGVKTRVYYDTKGRLIGDIRSYMEDNLPKDIRHQVKSTYYDFDIFHVNEVTVGNTKVYLVKIEDKTSFKTIRIQDGEMTETEAFQKSK